MRRTELSLDKIKVQILTYHESLPAAIRALRCMILLAGPLARPSTHATLFTPFDCYLRAKSLIGMANLDHDTASLLHAWKAEVVLVLVRRIIQERQKTEYAFGALRFSISVIRNYGTIRNRRNRHFDRLRGLERRLRASEERFLSEMSHMSASPIIVGTLQSMGGEGYAEGPCALWEVLKAEMRTIEDTGHIELPGLALHSNATLLGSAVELLCRKGAVANKRRGGKAADLRRGTRWL
jgi:hypothetical protein